jgi:RES domain-containing protein
LGSHWAESLTSAVLVVPSAIIPKELNYLLNPLHSDFSKLRFLDAEPFHFDPRLRRP